jgi:hypothetical protein
VNEHGGKDEDEGGGFQTGGEMNKVGDEDEGDGGFQTGGELNFTISESTARELREELKRTRREVRELREEVVHSREGDASEEEPASDPEPPSEPEPFDVQREP